MCPHLNAPTDLPHPCKLLGAVCTNYGAVSTSFVLLSPGTISVFRDIISSSGSLRDTIEDWRNKGWGKISEIAGILTKMPNTCQVEVGLNLRMAKLINGTIFSSEAWGKITEAELTRLEPVNFSLLRSQVSGIQNAARHSLYLNLGY